MDDKTSLSTVCSCVNSVSTLGTEKRSSSNTLRSGKRSSNNTINSSTKCPFSNPCIEACYSANEPHQAVRRRYKPGEVTSECIQCNNDAMEAPPPVQPPSTRALEVQCDMPPEKDPPAPKYPPLNESVCATCACTPGYCNYKCNAAKMNENKSDSWANEKQRNSASAVKRNSAPGICATGQRDGTLKSHCKCVTRCSRECMELKTAAAKSRNTTCLKHKCASACSKLNQTDSDEPIAPIAPLDQTPGAPMQMEESNVCVACQCTGICSIQCMIKKEGIKQLITPDDLGFATDTCLACDCTGECNPNCTKAKAMKGTKKPVCDSCTCKSVCTEECTLKKAEASKGKEVCNCETQCKSECDKLKPAMDADMQFNYNDEVPTEDVGVACQLCSCIGECNPTCELKKATSAGTQKSAPPTICEECKCPNPCQDACEVAKQEARKICEECVCNAVCLPKCEEKRRQKQSPSLPKICEVCTCCGKCFEECEQNKGKKKKGVRISEQVPEELIAEQLKIEITTPSGSQEFVRASQGEPKTPPASTVTDQDVEGDPRTSVVVDTERSSTRVSGQVPEIAEEPERASSAQRVSEAASATRTSERLSEAPRTSRTSATERVSEAALTPRTSERVSEVVVTPRASTAERVSEVAGTPRTSTAERVSEVAGTPRTSTAERVSEPAATQVKGIIENFEDKDIGDNFEDEPITPESKMISACNIAGEVVCEICKCDSDSCNTKCAAVRQIKSIGDFPATDTVCKVCECVDECTQACQQYKLGLTCKSAAGQPIVCNDPNPNWIPCVNCIDGNPCSPECRQRKAMGVILPEAPLPDCGLPPEAATASAQTPLPPTMYNAPMQTTESNLVEHATSTPNAAVEFGMQRSCGEPQASQTCGQIEENVQPKSCMEQQQQAQPTSCMEEQPQPCPQPEAPCGPPPAEAPENVQECSMCQKLRGYLCSVFQKNGNSPQGQPEGVCPGPGKANDPEKCTCNVEGRNIMDEWATFCECLPKSKSMDQRQQMSPEVRDSIQSTCKLMQRRSYSEKLQSVMGQMRAQCDEAELATSPYIKTASAFELDVHNQQEAIVGLLHKCRQKDNYIDALINELMGRSQSKVFDNLLMRLHEPVTNVPDFDRVLISNALDPKKRRANVCGIDLRSFKITSVKRVGATSVLVKWTPPVDNRVFGYEILVNSMLKAKVSCKERVYAILDALDFSATITIEIFAMTRNGRAHPSALAYYAKY